MTAVTAGVLGRAGDRCSPPGGLKGVSCQAEKRTGSWETAVGPTSFTESARELLPGLWRLPTVSARPGAARAREVH